MGLDISAYKKIKKVEVESDETCSLYPNDEFPDAADGIVKADYTFEDSMGFRAGPYSSYNRWREKLAELAGYPPTDIEIWSSKQKLCAAACWSGAKGPFSELINFSDCEGVIGPQTAAKLEKDFVEFDDRAKAIGDADGFYMKYQNFHAAMKMASESGAIQFH